MPPSPTTEAARPAEDDPPQRTILGLPRACDVVFGATTVGLALLGVWPLAMARNEYKLGKGTTFTIGLAIDGAPHAARPDTS